MPREAAEKLVVMVAPLAPHIAEELWQRLGHEESITFAAFPVADPALLVEDTVTCVVQIKGKVRDRLEVPADITEDALPRAGAGAAQGRRGDRGRHPHRHRPRARPGQRRAGLSCGCAWWHRRAA